VSSNAFDRTSRGGLAFDGKNYGASYSGHPKIWSSYFTGLARNGSPVVAETPLTEINSETYAGVLLHNGAYFASAWKMLARRQLRSVFHRFDSKGKKLGPDLRVTNAPNFSLHSAMVYNGVESVIVWGRSALRRSHH